LKIVQLAEIALEQDQKEDEELGELPEEFTDPVMFSLMEDPVVLPSGVTVDMSTIRTHLLSDPHDPFNRQPLKIEDCIPSMILINVDVELKERIIAWKKERKSSRMRE
jgi:ubiquitin conjugation factor E4 B